MEIFCIDIGNTHTHFGIVSDGRAPVPDVVDSREIAAPDSRLRLAIQTFQQDNEKPPIAFCSVNPPVSKLLRGLFEELAIEEVFQLTAKVRLDMKISYPAPEEIGQDRLANAVAATAFYPLPCIVIDLGTAVTFDIVTASGGYEGGLIAPGLRIMTEYLHKQTAQLPLLDDEFAVSGAIGRSTADAMKIGCLIGFRGMVQALLDAVSRELTERGERAPTILTTGGAARFLQNALRQSLIDAPGITLRGLARAWELNRKP